MTHLSKKISRQFSLPEAELTPLVLDFSSSTIGPARKHRLDKKKIADELGMSLRTLYLRLEKMGLPRKKKQLEKYLGIG